MTVRMAAVAIVACVQLWFAQGASAHCDTLGGPVVTDAKLALTERNVTPALRWVAPPHEAEVREAFDRALRVRKSGGDAALLADQFFFETVVRLHRASEGEPYTGLKPADDVEPVIARADQALVAGTSSELEADLLAHMRKGIQERFTRLLARKARASENLAAGREFVAAYVDFMHYLEGLDRALSGSHGAPVHTEHDPRR